MFFNFGISKQFVSFKNQIAILYIFLPTSH